MKFIVSLLVFLISCQCFSTIQIKDRLCYEGINYELQEYYLETYFDKYPDKRPKNDMTSTNLWRGYVAMFKVIDRKIYLDDLIIKVHVRNPEGFFETNWQSVFHELSPNDDPIFIDWITDLVLLPLGEVLDYEQGFGISFENYNLLEIKNGRLLNTTTFSLDFYRSLFDKYHGFLREEDVMILKEKLSE